MRRRGRHDQGASVPEHVQERAHYRRSTAHHPADRTQGGMDQQGHPGRDADARKVPSETGFRRGPPLDIHCRKSGRRHRAIARQRRFARCGPIIASPLRQWRGSFLLACPNPVTPGGGVASPAAHGGWTDRIDDEDRHGTRRGPGAHPARPVAGGGGPPARVHWTVQPGRRLRRAAPRHDDFIGLHALESRRLLTVEGAFGIP